eukprot:scaffold600_cov385-Prasinococcus_capsulatus_cf.AAC.4
MREESEELVAPSWTLLQKFQRHQGPPPVAIPRGITVPPVLSGTELDHGLLSTRYAPPAILLGDGLSDRVKEALSFLRDRLFLNILETGTTARLRQGTSRFTKGMPIIPERRIEPPALQRRRLHVLFNDVDSRATAARPGRGVCWDPSRDAHVRTITFWTNRRSCRPAWPRAQGRPRVLGCASPPRAGRASCTCAAAAACCQPRCARLGRRAVSSHACARSRVAPPHRPPMLLFVRGGGPSPTRVHTCAGES